MVYRQVHGTSNLTCVVDQDHEGERWAYRDKKDNSKVRIYHEHFRDVGSAA